MKFILTPICLILYISTFAQKSDSTSIRSRTIRADFTEKYTVLKSNKDIKNGLAEVFFNTHKIAAGHYANNERVGPWNFYFLDGGVDQTYNYTTKKLEFESQNKMATYQVDGAAPGDETINPIKIGGGYAAILIMSKLSNAMLDLRTKKGSYTVNDIYTLDDSGRLTRLEIKTEGLNYSKTMNVDLNLLKPEEMEFKPGYLNGKPARSTLILTSKLTVN